MQFGFPEFTDSYLAGQDVLYTQFNDIEFYVEDEDQEHFYYNILKKIFNDIKLEKIFPLNGKKNIIAAAKSTYNQKRKIYVVDLDFDEILNRKENLPNLFYLRKYSIENYLISKQSLIELIREKNTKLKNADIERLFSYDKLLQECNYYLSDLTTLFIMSQKYSFGRGYYSIEPNRDFDFKNPKFKYKNKFIVQYFNDIEILLKRVDKRYTINSQIKKLKNYFILSKNGLDNIPGKHLLSFIKFRLNKLILESNLESMTYRLSKHCAINELEFLRIEINNFINSN